MRIHTSSLTSSPTRIIQPNAAKASVGDITAAFFANEADNTHKPEVIDTSTKSSKELPKISLQTSLSNTINYDFPNNFRLSRALSAYHQELSRPLFESNNYVSINIDTFV